MSCITNPGARARTAATLMVAGALAGALPAPAAYAGSGKATVLHIFHGTPDGNNPGNRLLPLAGALYGATAYGGSACAALPTGCGTIFQTVPSPHGTAQNVVWRFKGPPSDGAEPGSGLLIADASGSLYGTTIGGGNGACNYFGLAGCGVVFKLTPTARGYSESVIYNFQGKHDGANPVYGVVADSAGNLYGTTSAGGSKACPGGGCGVVYELKLTPSGYVESVMHRFTGADGAYPDAAPIIDAVTGTLYGTAFDGGTGTCQTYGGGCGAVYSLTPDGRKFNFSLIYSFQGGADGVQVQSGLLEDKRGALYGMTTYGGTGPCAVTGLPNGCGTVFALTPNGGGYTKSTLYNFQGTDGSLPTGNLYAGPGGRLYGTTPFGGSGTCNDYGIVGCGTLFSLSASANGFTEKVLYNFAMGTNKGIYPNDPLIQGSKAFVSTCCGSLDQFGALDVIAVRSGN